MPSWLIIVVMVVVVVSLAVGPVMWMKPSKSQRRLSKLRAYALKQGLRVHMQQVPGREKQTDGAEGSPLVAVYCLAWTGDAKERKTKFQNPENKAWSLARGQISHDIHFQGEWDWSPAAKASPKWHATIKKIIAELPPGIEALEMNSMGTCMYWRENGGEETVDKIKVLLQELHEKF